MMSNNPPENRICTRCVMDTTDPEIRFDENGICNHCKKYDELIRKCVFDGPDAEAKLQKLIRKIKDSGRGKDYDCIIGMSGGVDSSFVAYKVKEFGLRPLAVHLDNGWDSELAVKNIELLLKKLDIDLYTHVIDWEEFKDLQISFLKASTPDAEIPSDHAINAILYQVAEKYGITYILWGCNMRTESHLPRSWSQGHIDWRYIKAVHKEFGHVPLKTYPRMGFWKYHYYLMRHKSVNILNYLNYSKTDAVRELETKLGWRYYGGKHFESIYTRFYQGYILPRKFGFDKRKTHLSSLICSGEISRNDALEELKQETYPQMMQEEDRKYVIKKMGLTDQEFEEIMTNPPKRYEDFPSYYPITRSRIYTYSIRLAYLLKILH